MRKHMIKQGGTAKKFVPARKMIIVDVKGEDKKKLTVSDLLDLFTKASGAQFASDRALLS